MTRINWDFLEEQKCAYPFLFSRKSPFHWSLLYVILFVNYNCNSFNAMSKLEVIQSTNHKLNASAALQSLNKGQSDCTWSVDCSWSLFSNKVLLLLPGWKTLMPCSISSCRKWGCVICCFFSIKVVVNRTPLVGFYQSKAIKCEHPQSLASCIFFFSKPLPYRPEFWIK